jgi:hypothetical protein
MKSVDFPEANRVLGAPAGMEADCDPLNVLVGEDLSCMSVWEMDAAELTTLKVNGGRICVWVHNGNGTQPPIALTVPGPWEVAEAVHVDHDSTNKGPTVRKPEVDDLRMIIAAMHKDEVRTVQIPIGLFERLVHTADMASEKAPDNRG